MKEIILQYKLPIAIALYLLFHYLFWEHQLGISWAIFNLVTVCLLLCLNPNALKRPSRVILLIGFLLTGFAFIWHYSTVAMLAHASLLFILIAALQEDELILLLYIWGKGIQNYLSGTARFVRSMSLQGSPQNSKKARSLLSKRTYILFIPSLFIAVFFTIFMIANPYFANLVNEGLEQIEQLWLHLIGIISIEYIFFMVFGLWWIFHLFEKSGSQYFLTLQAGARLHIIRKRRKIPPIISFNMLSLKAEYLSAIILLSGVNLLLLIINILDIQNIWLFWDWSLAPKLKYILHTGTYWLIASILLSMAILIYFFRENLNFYPNNTWLKRLAYVWIFQNGILAISVAFRCYYYIVEYGLAYKRIGVLIFLFLVFFGLFTMFQKISQTKSFYYLWHLNTWVALVVFVGMSLVDWDSLIVSHNLKYHAKSKKMDLGFVLSRSDKTLPILHKYRHQLRKRFIHHDELFTTFVYEVEEYNGMPASDYIKRRVTQFKEEANKKTWQEWNRAEAYTEYFFRE